MIRQEFQYPREDIWELRNRFSTLEETVKRLEEQMDPEEPYSWVATQQRYQEETRKELARLGHLWKNYERLMKPSMSVYLGKQDKRSLS
jgi:mannose-1-phosphate guanylyltransferase